MKNSENRTLSRGLDILLLFDEMNPSLTISEMVEKLKIPRSTVYRFVYILKQKGLLEPIGQGLYQPGWLASDLARIVSATTNLTEISLPIMKTLSEETKETVALTCPFGTKARVIAHVESPQQLQLSYKTGQERSLHKGAPSKIILANLEENYRRIVLSKIEDSCTISELEKELELIRKQGFVVTSNEVDQGVRGISAPIFRPNKTILGGVNVAGPEFRINHEQLPMFIHLTKKAAREITELLAVN